MKRVLALAVGLGVTALTTVAVLWLVRKVEPLQKAAGVTPAEKQWFKVPA